MSAFLCNSEHIALLAAYAANNGAVLYDHGQQMALINARYLAGVFAEANLDSLAARYEDMPRDESDRQFIVECKDKAEHYYFQPPRLEPVEIIKHAQCLDYQCCEVSDWEGSTLCRQIQAVINAAIRRLAGYESAEWGFSDNKPLPPKSERPVLLIG